MTATTTGGVTSPALELSDRIREATAGRRALRVIAGGSWLDANRPVRADATVEIGAHGGIVEYEPGDLTLTARAGTALDEIARITAVHGQWLSLDPFGDPARATIGATVATASYGPLAHHFGTPRDMTLGVQFVSGSGDVVRGGGRVVKNVAGFDLTRLLTGSWGTLGVITEVTVRLRALPMMEATLAVDIFANEAEVERARAALRLLPFVPLAAQFLDRLAAGRQRVASGGTAVLLVRIGGNEEAVLAQREQLRAVGETREIEADVWRRLRADEPVRAAVFRLSQRPSAFATTWCTALRIIERWPEAYCLGDPGRGVVRVVLPLGKASDTELSTVLTLPFRGARVYERLPATLWPSLAPTAMRGLLDRRVKAAFDPHHVLNPGILGVLE